MEGQGQGNPAASACDFALLASLPAVPADTCGVEAEVMSLFEQYRAPLLRYAVSSGVSVSDAEEIVQEVFLALFRHLRLGRPRQNLRGWLFRVAHNLTLRQRHATRRLLEMVDNDSGIAELRVDPSSNPEQACSEGQRQQRLLAVVQSLPDIEQSCLRMRAEGLRCREIANALGISLGSVSTFLTRSLARLVRADRG